MVKMTKEQIAALKTMGKAIDVEELSDEAVEELQKIIEEHRNDIIAYVVDEDDMHRILSHAYILERDDDKDLRKRIADAIRYMYRHAKPLTLSTMVVIIESMTQLDEKEKKQSDE